MRNDHDDERSNRDDKHNNSPFQKITKGVLKKQMDWSKDQSILIYRSAIHKITIKVFQKLLTKFYKNVCYEE